MKGSPSRWSTARSNPRARGLPWCGWRPALGAAVLLSNLYFGFGSSYSVDWGVVACGGDTSAAGPYTMCDTIGQPMAETMSGGFDHVAFGFWAIDAYPPPPPLLQVSPDYWLAQVGESAGFSVTATGPQPAGYQWRFEGDDLSEGPDVVGTKSAELALHNVTRTRAGTYQAQARGYFGSAVSGPAILDVNYPPLARPNTMGARLNLPAQTSTDRLLANDVDEDGDPLFVVSVTSPSEQGGDVVLELDTLTYTPPSGFLGTDSFTYTISDGRGGSATTSITVTVAAGGPVALRVEVVGSTVVIQFAGVPGWSYRVQRATEINGPWSDIDIVTAPPPGAFAFIDTDPPSPMAFYRLSRNN